MRSQHLSRILFAVDDSASSHEAVPGVADLALRSRATVLVFHARLDPSHDRMARVLQEFVEKIREGGVHCGSEIRKATSSQGVAGAVSGAASAFNADLVALGSRGRSDLSGLLLGSVSHQVVARGTLPVVVFRRQHVFPKAENRRILLAVGDLNSNAPATAAMLAKAQSAEILVVHVRHVVADGESAKRVETEEEARQVTDHVTAELVGIGIKASTVVATGTSSIAREIVAAAAEYDADQIVMGSRRLSDLQCLLWGGPDKEVIAKSDRPVVIA